VTPPGGRYDVIVVGVGTMGAAAAFHLARRGQRVLGLEQFGLVHDRGSMHGQTRIIRLAYHEQPGYVGLLRRAYELWRELEARTSEPLLEVIGSLSAGPEDGAVVSGSLLACRQHGLEHELLSTSELSSRYPAYAPPDGTVAVLQPDGGFLWAERCVQAHGDAARAEGAELRLGERVLDWKGLPGGGVSVRTDRGTYEAGRLVLCPGAWADELMQLPVEGLLTVTRQVVAWFDTHRSAMFDPQSFPVFVIESDGRDHYGFPEVGRPGVKVGRMNHPGRVVDPDSFERAVTSGELEVLRGFVAEWFPAGAGEALDTVACMFTNTPDRHFLVDLHPTEPDVVIGSVCSGHGFKFASVVGEILAELVIDGSTRHEIGFLRLDRFLTHR
jgi:sarcosine oxidase